jgi:hypothetical protein
MTMKAKFIGVGLTAALALTTGCAKKTVAPDSVPTRIGDLKFVQGYPTEETAKKLFDEMDYQRAVQAYLWAYPAVSFESIRIAMKNEGIGLNEIIIADNFADPKAVWLTANDTTIYGATNIDLSKDGPVVVDIPPGPIVGIIDDYWQKSVADLGMPGPDGDKGGKFLLLPPGYKGEVPQSGYHVINATSNNYNAMVRGLVINGQKDTAVQIIRSVKVYPYGDRANPKPNKFVSMSGSMINTLPPQGLEYWARLSAFINNNPVAEHDRFYMAMLKPLGIEKGKPFQPDARQKKILEDAARTGDAMGRVMLYEGHHRFTNAKAIPGTYWNWTQVLDPTHETKYYSQLDERLHYTYGAITPRPAWR